MLFIAVFAILAGCNTSRQIEWISPYKDIDWDNVIQAKAQFHAHTTVSDGEFLMWYRIRDNKERGRGYGFARSSDGLNWNKYENNPLFTHDPEFSSNEKICVLKVDGLYRAWYAVDTPRGWFTAYATSEDGREWKQHGLAIDETYCKDVAVIYLDGTYYLYSIKDNDKIGIYTSANGVDFTHRNTIDIGVHRHVAAFYEKKTGLFHLYSTADKYGKILFTFTIERRREVDFIIIRAENT